MATLQSAGENAFAIGLLSGAAGEANGAYFGLRRVGGPPGWQWVDGQSLSWSAWGNGSCAGGPYPNNVVIGGEMVAHLYKQNCGWVWDDTPPSWFTDQATLKLLVEWDADCNNDGIVDYGQIRAGQLPDFNGNNIPDCCDQGIPCTVGNYPVQWRASEGGNGHWYQARQCNCCFEEAAVIATSIGGQLASIDEDGEQSRVVLVVPSTRAAKLGGFREPAADQYVGWQWLSGRPFNPAFVSWADGNPGCCGPEQYWLLLQATPGPGFGLHDGFRCAQPGADFMLIEWSVDCNNDGIVDLGQILNGQLTDSNGDGVPDVCQGIVTVPGNFATIQAAIDSTPNGASRIINVAAGSYAGPIDFKGKNVVVRGAGAGATILAGTGGATRAVVNMAGEPSTAALERVTVQWGYTGTPFPGTPSALCGGGIFANASSAAIRDCEISNNGAGYGGGAYLLSCTSTIERCTVRANSATGGGGGIQFYGGQNKVIDTVVQNNNCTSVGGGIALVGGLQQIIRTSVRDNTAGLGAGAVWWTAVGQSAQSPAFLTLTDSVLTGNRTTSGPDGGMQLLADQPNTFVSLTDTQVCGNLPRPNISGRWSDLGGNTVCECIGDVSGDGQVNGADIGVLLSAWGPCGITCPGDLNHDGMINGFDLGLMLANWGPCAP